MAVIEDVYDRAFAVYGNPNATVNQVKAVLDEREAAAEVFLAAMENNGPGTLKGKTITITGLNAYNGQEAYIVLYDNFSEFNAVAAGDGQIANGAVTIDLYKAEEDPDGQKPQSWTGQGSYWVILDFGGNIIYLYTDGAAIPSPLSGAPKLAFTNTDTTATFSQFKLIEFGAGGHEITITGISSEWNGADASVSLADYQTIDGYLESITIAGGWNTVSGGSVTVSLADAVDMISGWNPTGTQQHWVELYLEKEDGYGDYTEVFYIYTNGQSLTQLNIEDWDDINKALKYSFSGTSSSIALSRFAEMPLSGGSPNNPTFTITGMPYDQWNNEFQVILQNDTDNLSGDGRIAPNGDGIVSVYGWDASGSYQIIVNTNRQYVYTDGASLSSLDIANWGDVYDKAPEYDFQTGVVIAWDQFKALDFPGADFPPAQFTELTVDQWANETISEGDEDWYRFTAVAGTTYYLWTNDLYGGDGTTTADIYFNAWYDDGDWVFDGDDCWYGPEEFYAAKSGTVYIKVECYDDESGSYALAYTTVRNRPDSVTLNGTINMDNGPYIILAMLSSISSIDDLYEESIFDSMVGEAETFDGSWSMFLVPPMPSTLWFFVWDFATNDVYITNSALSTDGTVELNTGNMIYLGTIDDDDGSGAGSGAGSGRSGAPALPEKQAVKFNSLFGKK